MAMRKGSYNGIAFYAESHDLETGRRIVVTEYPQKNAADTEDMGRAARHFTLDMIILGKDYMAYRDILQADLEEGGIGELVHPWLGKLKVRAGKVRLRETSRERMKAVITVEFHEAAEPPQDGDDIASDKFNRLAASFDAAAVKAFSEDFSVEGAISRLVSAAEQSIGAALAVMAGVSGRLNGLNDLATRIRAISQSITSLVLTPANLALQLMAAVHTITDTHFNPLGALRNQLSLARQSARAVSTSAGTGTARQAAANANAVSALIRSLAIAEAVRLYSGQIQRATVVENATAAGVIFDTRNDAAAARDAILEQMDELMPDASDLVYAALMDTQAAVVSQFRAIAPAASLEVVSVPASLPMLVIAQRLYGDGSMADDLVKRNAIAHPLFVPAGTELEVRRG